MRTTTTLLLPLLAALAPAAQAKASAADSDAAASLAGSGPNSQSPLQYSGASCGSVNIFLTGFIPSDPQVISAGFDPTAVRTGLETDQAAIAAQGYNVRFALVSSDNEAALDDIRGELARREYHGTVIGYGVRGSRDPGVSFLFTDMVGLFRDETRVPLLFNWSPTSTGEAVKRRFPLAGNCTATPGENLGWAEYPQKKA